ncbi:DUF5988 family protein [Salinispora vitiensis]|uniref:DUF5988 family protein n=1 Tax=Salinispora vitiensis TaxID=999544 RepID=UPI00035C4997|nr:DUF5988 family protein [Salinispora vitiensis]
MAETKSTTEEPSDFVDVILEGGPDLPGEWREQRVAPGDYKVKIAHNGGYEHFERTEAYGRTPVVFRWTQRTRIAE